MKYVGNHSARVALGTIRILAALTAVLLLAPLASATGDKADDKCADVATSTSSGTNAQVSTSNGYAVVLTGAGQQVSVRALGSGCIGYVTAKSSQPVFQAIEMILEQAPPLP